MYDMTIYVTMAEAVKWKARKKHRHKQVYQYFQLHKNICRNDKIISKFVNNRLNSLSRYPVYIFNKNNGISQPSSVLL